MPVRMLKRHTIIALIYFMIIAILGVLLRFFAITDIPVSYKYIVHTHSHIALLGWVYTALTTVIYFSFLRSQPIKNKYRIIFWFTQVTIVGMLLTFPFTGYALFSIIFSSLFLIASYWFVYFFFKHCPKSLRKTGSYKLIRISLWYMVISSIGPWALGVIMNTAGSGSTWYRNAIYFYLHFQYNGWFIVALCGIFLYILEKRSFIIPQKLFDKFYYLLNAGVILTFFLSLLWMRPHWSFYLLALIGGVFQLIAFGVLFRAIYSKAIFAFKSLSPMLIFSIRLVVFLLFVKLIAQVLGSFPVIAESIFTNLDMIISYIHWVFLGIVSVLLLAFLNNFKLLKLTRTELYIYLTGFFLTEFLIFFRGLAGLTGIGTLASIHLLISLASIIIFTALALILGRQLLSKD
ncbi:hypothetical protein [Christiangramia sediminis]|uniref:Uncharacterized protein n=1 Tax=Christiangramia sediminis TaxID=2881336 RepID=A0A9X1LKI5_9FLAO|nr:hypothetical protein [Christiangramia sediminis]MCB7482099.1 hypothetical protein [Christiangramia sediminis]